ncbi:hypothetical protein [Chitinophaga nivalis]|uniref:Glycosyltransferase RgtA/B/C/D-like domain-containing protein n=1 Tax=Chitinophaga nivalis TaxID=2991709 RepID=A0ABT3INT4_9BACT|nr:hypothetical protein [Chitinophaga nivalis]MCW3464665.1 hypothetical protein [Chitinophaga nivalis]MCW3485644.1 hypothetical protein [Chitinophaga nivalis]
MKSKSVNINLLFLLNFIFACTAGLLSMSLTTFLLAALLTGGGLLWINVLFKDKTQRQYAGILYLVFFLVYGCFMLITNQTYVQDPFKDIFYAKDSVLFYTYIDKIAGMNSISEIGNYYKDDFFAGDWKGFAYLSSVLGFWAKGIDTNNLILQKLQIVFCSAFILVILFKILSHYIVNEISVQLTVIYALLSYNFFFSAVYLRDVHIGLLFGLYALLLIFRKGFWGILYGILLTVLIYLFRPEHGYFSVTFLLAYVYLFVTDKNNVTANKFKIPILVLLTLPALTQIVVLQQGFNTIQSTSENYYDSSMSNAGLGSFGSMLLKLPFGVRHVAVGLFSQTLPFPFYAVLEENPFFIFWALAALFWFVVWVVLIYTSAFKPRNPFFQIKELRVLFLIAVLLILGASSNADTRRIMAVYPVIYVIFCGGILSLPKLKRKQLIGASLLGYFGLVFIYAFIK